LGVNGVVMTCRVTIGPTKTGEENQPRWNTIHNCKLHKGRSLDEAVRVLMEASYGGKKAAVTISQQLDKPTGEEDKPRLHRPD